MANEPHKLILLPNRSYQAVARSEIKKIALTVGFSAKRMAELEIVVAEITSNLVKHTKNGGELLVRVFEGENAGIEIISIDAGPGMEAVHNMMEDGVSSTNTLGQGLGAIKRFSDEFDTYSLPGWGTVLLSRIHKNAVQPGKKKSVEVGVIMVAKEGETKCGDDYMCVLKGNHLKFVVCDGLGHGENAHEAANTCLALFKANINLTSTEQIREIHTGARRTRGAVMFLSHIDFNNKQISYCGVGNISIRIQSLGKYKSCVSYNGIVGHSIPSTMNNHVMQWSKTDMLIVHSDGLSARWDLQKYPAITRHDCTIIAAALYKDFYRKTDDVTVAVIRQHFNKTP